MYFFFKILLLHYITKMLNLLRLLGDSLKFILLIPFIFNWYHSKLIEDKLPEMM